MKTKTGTAADFGITLTGTQLKNFNRRFRDAMYKEYSFRSKVLTALGGLSMAGLSIWLLAANVSSLPIMLLMMIPPVIGIALTAISPFEKNKAIGEQLRTSAALAMFLVLINTVCYVRGGDKSFFIANDRLYVVGGKEYLPLYILLAVIALLGVLSGVLGWSRLALRTMTKDSQSTQKKPNYSIIGLLAVSSVPIVRVIFDGARGRASLKFAILVIVMVMMFSMLGYFLGISAGNIRYIRYLDRGNKEN